MNTIYFKNGKTKKVSNSIAQTLHDRLLDGCNQFQMFTDAEKKVTFIVNIFEIVWID